MDVSVQYLSFYVIQTEGPEAQGGKRYKHYQTLDAEDYEDSEIRQFLEGEFARICRRKADRNPATEAAPTKIGRFVTEPGYGLDSNPNYNQFERLRLAETAGQFQAEGEVLAEMYTATSSVRGGALILASAKLPQYLNEPLLFILKCDFEPKIARISDERNLISQVEMAISARNMKSIQYPHMPEPGILEPWEIKVHQASHARYFEDFLKFVEYGKTKPEIVGEQVMGLVRRFMEEKWRSSEEEERQQEEEKFEIWAASDKRELQETWTHEQVVEATRQLADRQPDLEFQVKVDGISVRGAMADYGSKIHIARSGDRYVLLIEGTSLHFGKMVSPIELLQPAGLEEVVRYLLSRAEADNDNVPWD